MDKALELREQIILGGIVSGSLSPNAWDEMVKAFAAAGRDGNAEAWWQLGRAHMSGLNTFDPDPASAVAAWEKAWDAAAGREAGLAIVQTCYFERLDVVAPDKLRATLDTLLEDDEDGAARLLAGWMHYAGFLFDRDLERAAELHTEAAGVGNADAMFELSVLYDNGEGVEANPETSHAWCVKAAEAGNVRAMYNLAAAYATGSAGELDKKKAVEWYARAAEEGHGRAAATLSFMYATGEGIPEDLDEAENYFRLAFVSGYNPNLVFEAMGHQSPFKVE